MKSGNLSLRQRMENQEILEEQGYDLTPRQWWLYRLIKWASENEKKLSIKEIIEYQTKYEEANKLTFTDLYQFKETEGNHSNCPEIYKDKDIINEFDKIDKIICVKNNQFYLGTEKEEIEYHNKLMHNVCRDSHKAKIIRDKISQDGQMKLFTYDLVIMEESNGRDYHQAFIRQESLIKEIEKLEKKVEDLKLQLKAQKNEADMWRDRYNYLKSREGN